MYKPKLPANVKPLDWISPEHPNAAQSGLVHTVHIPPQATQARPAPLVLLLHGWGGDESAMWLFKQTLPRGVAAVAPRAPIRLDSGGFVWFTYENSRFQPHVDTLEAALEKLSQFFASLPRLYPVDPTRAVLMGFSQGAAISTAYIATHPDSAIGVVSLAGGVLQLPNVNPHPGLLAGLPVFITHGTRDDIVPLSAAEQTRQYYTQLGADVTYNQYPTGHKITTDGMKDLKAWLARLFPKT